MLRIDAWHSLVQNDEFATIFNLEDYKASREKCYKQIAAAIAKFREIKENINEGLKFYVTLQDAITNVKQQCSDFIMTRNIQCREMIEDVQRQIAGLSFSSDGKGGYNYPSAGQPHPSVSIAQQAEPQSAAHPSHPQMSPYRPPPEQPRPAFPQSYPPYTAQRQPPYHALPSMGSHYQHPQQAPNPEYGQPAYPGWRGPYYNEHPQQPGSFPRPPYTIPGPYPPGGYYSKPGQ